MNRRELLRSTLFTIASTSFFGGEAIAKATGLPLLKRSKDTFASLLKNTDGDKVDIKKGYLRHFRFEKSYKKWVHRTESFLNDHAFNLSLPSGSAVVEFGAYYGERLDLFKSHYGSDFNVFGVERYPYVSRKDIYIMDARKFDRFTPNMEVGLAWNNVGRWKTSPRSKKAVHDYLMSKIVPGGYLIEDSMSNVPSDIEYPGFELIADNGFLSLLRKV